MKVNENSKKIHPLVHFGAKEEHMQKLNDFITENVDALHRYFDAISVSSGVKIY